MQACRKSPLNKHSCSISSRLEARSGLVGFMAWLRALWNPNDPYRYFIISPWCTEILTFLSLIGKDNNIAAAAAAGALAGDIINASAWFLHLPHALLSLITSSFVPIYTPFTKWIFQPSYRLLELIKSINTNIGFYNIIYGKL